MRSLPFFTLGVLVLFGFARVSFAGISLAPLGGTNPVYGVFFGGAAFFENEEKTRRYGLMTVLTLKDSYQMKPDARWDPEGPWKIEWKSELSMGFDPYFGEGIRTTNVQTNLFNKKVKSRVSFGYFFNEDESVTPFVGFMGRKADGIDNDPNRILFPHEGSFYFGVMHSIERKDRNENPRHGWHTFVSAWVIPRETFTSRYEVGTIAQAEARYGMMRQIFPRWVLASQVMANTSLGHPSYSHRFRLGGTDRLRGYYDNRFRGEDLVLLQTELRFPLFWLLSGVVFADQGSVSDEFTFDKVRATYGGGLRVALPPDRVQQARIDFGIAPDQMGVFVDFGHTF